MKDFCVVLVFNKSFVGKSFDTIKQIREVGLYKGDIVCIIGDDLKKLTRLIHKDKNLVVKYFPDMGRTKERNDQFGVNKPFQFHKFYCFHSWFRENYKKCFYMDVGMSIFKPLDKIINLDCAGKILAHSDAYPTYKSKLSDQFDKKQFPEQYKQLEAMYNLDVDYFQSTMMLYDTSIISEYTFATLVKLSNVYQNNKTNTQGFMNLYFNCLLKVWEQIQIRDSVTHYYDFYEREGLDPIDYIMVKYSQEPNKEHFGSWSFSIELFNWVRNNLSTGKTILGLGSGNATKELTKYFKVYSIEHNKEWVGHAKRSNYIHAPIVQYEGYKWYDKKIVKKSIPEDYDLLLVDGPQGDIGREGFVHNIDLFKTDIPIILDDTNRHVEATMRNELAKKLNKKVLTFDGAGKKFSILL